MRKRPAATVAALLTVCTLTGGLIGAAGAAPDQATDSGRTEKTTAATATDSVTHEENERVPEGARWTRHYFPSSYNRIAGLAQLPDEDKRYRTNAVYEKKHPECLVLNFTQIDAAKLKPGPATFTVPPARARR